MRQTGYRIVKEKVDIDVILVVKQRVKTDTEEYYIFDKPVQIFSDDVLTVGDEEIKAGRRVSECIGYSVKNGKFDHFLVKLT
jgi:hypothetical protein